jgi:hypothetical protein
VGDDRLEEGDVRGCPHRVGRRRARRTVAEDGAERGSDLRLRSDRLRHHPLRKRAHPGQQRDQDGIADVSVGEACRETTESVGIGPAVRRVQ